MKISSRCPFVDEHRLGEILSTVPCGAVVSLIMMGHVESNAPITRPVLDPTAKTWWIPFLFDINGTMRTIGVRTQDRKVLEALFGSDKVLAAKTFDSLLIEAVSDNCDDLDLWYDEIKTPHL